MSDRISSSSIASAEKFANRLGIHVPILLAPMAGACPPSLSIAVANAVGVGACGGLMMKPDVIRSWIDACLKLSQGAFQIILWSPVPAPPRDLESEREVREFLAKW